MRTTRNQPGHTLRPAGYFAALGVISGLLLGCGESDEKPAPAASPSPVVRSEKPARPSVRPPGPRAAVSEARSDGGDGARLPILRIPSADGTVPVSITADESVPPVLSAPGLTAGPESSETKAAGEGAGIGPMDAASVEAFDALAAAYRDHKPADYETAEGRLIARGAAAVPLLLAKLTDSRAETRELASMMVLRIVPETILVDVNYPLERRTIVLERLTQALDDPSADVRANVASTLALFPEDLPALLPALRKLLAADMSHQRLMAVVAIGNLGPKASPATADVAKLLEDGDADVRSAAKQTLDLIRPLGE
jgi:hypothetical protein